MSNFWGQITALRSVCVILLYAAVLGDGELHLCQYDNYVYSLRFFVWSIISVGQSLVFQVLFVFFSCVVRAFLFGRG